ncbi:3-deoxy-D-manno-octulosonate 8-phosphate phosphatase, YrbI family [Desulfobulbus propionicus DSM 2032]|uniref:3-deoxy-D-manno-octulosonate 8-phosphate phosphatase KdsC n=1 Tax=Desulfobulbus propionicus (strain ATCC 33891 / DSM 2032 / VKM B-1956 / 1pr3) TaxID=577650 RepID=A0A7U3YQ91_DESPD|nr:HAD hydrolase family protein [Desulfobulbus propionicus]ADW19448.1 3-deoxy-D-manno-octulosonate 8-phosphate phosphatase, YrbI family [Desulfobulbus propionicus DSM 2032]
MQRDGCGMPGGGYPTDCELTEALRNRAMARNRPVERGAAWLAALPQARQIRLLLLDVDGVLTDGTITYTSGGGETKSFNTQDGLGIKLLQDSGVAVGIITARTSEAVARRAQDLRLAHVFQGKQDKLTVYESILKQTGLRPPQTGFMGDDLMDLPILNRVGLAVAPANAVAEIRQRVHYTTERGGGHGAVREVCDLILEAQGNLARMQATFDR